MPRAKPSTTPQSDTKRRSTLGERERVVRVHLSKGTAIVGAGYDRVLVREWWELRIATGPLRRLQPPYRGEVAQFYSRSRAHVERSCFGEAFCRVVHVRRYRVLKQGA